MGPSVPDLDSNDITKLTLNQHNKRSVSANFVDTISNKSHLCILFTKSNGLKILSIEIHLRQ